MSIDIKKATRKTLLKDRERYEKFLEVCNKEQKPLMRRLIADIDFEIEERDRKRRYYLKRNNIK